MFRERVISDDSLAAMPDGYQLSVRIPWYRALPVSSLVTLQVVVDGVPAPADALTVEINGRTRTLPEAAGAWDDVWYVLDDAIVRAGGVSLPAGGEHEVDVTIGIRIPYLPINGEPLVITERYVKTMPVKEIAA